MTAALRSLSSAGLADARSKPSAKQDEAKQVAKQFESLLLSELVKAMRATANVGPDDGGGAFASGTYQEMFDQALVDASAGGLGLSTSLERQLGGAIAGAVATQPKQWQPRAAIPEEVAAIGDAHPLPRKQGPTRAAIPVDRNAIIGTSFESAAPQPGLWPVDGGHQSSGYGWRMHPIHKEKRFHGGLDIAAPEGREIRAVQKGVVTVAERHPGYGNMVEITHPDGVVTKYAHASRLHVRVGDTVDVGECIADVGSTGQSTGPHLHFGVREKGRNIDPAAYLERLRAEHRAQSEGGGKPRTGLSSATVAARASLARDVNSEDVGDP
jgi:murein DD-endopeptidase MepM/ murein hydrolase activator NlpD